MIQNQGPACRCGVRRKPANSTLFVNDDGKCFAHPDRPAQPYSIGAEPSCCENPRLEVERRDGEGGRACRSCGKFFRYGVNVDAWSKVMDVTVLTELFERKRDGKHDS